MADDRAAQFVVDAQPADGMGDGLERDGNRSGSIAECLLLNARFWGRRGGLEDAGRNSSFDRIETSSRLAFPGS
jgi:hypothetical protein